MWITRLGHGVSRCSYQMLVIQDFVSPKRPRRLDVLDGRNPADGKENVGKVKPYSF